MKGLPLANMKTIINKLFVFGIHGPFYNFITPIKVIIEYRVADMLHVDPYLVGTAGFQDTFH